MNPVTSPTSGLHHSVEGLLFVEAFHIGLLHHGEDSGVVDGHHLLEVGDLVVPVLDELRGDSRVSVCEVILHGDSNEFAVLVVELLQKHHLVVELCGENIVRVVDVGNATTHAGPKVSTGCTEHDHTTAGHVLATVIADALDDCSRARVAHTEPLANHAAQ